MAWGAVALEVEKKRKAGTTQKPKNVMIQDERKGSRGRGVMAGGGESESERKMEGEWEGGPSSQSQLAMPTCASCS